VGGGLAADLYRKDTRSTGDIDMLLLANGRELVKGKEILASLNLIVGEIKLHHLRQMPSMNKKNQEVFILVGRSKNIEDPGVDLLLPTFPWFANAIRRAQSNLVDFGFGDLPVLTAEDVIIAKLFAKRFKDLDDVQSIFQSEISLDIAYLEAEMERLALVVPVELLEVAPKTLKPFMKRRARKR
jgi:hypothetical protein